MAPNVATAVLSATVTLCLILCISLAPVYISFGTDEEKEVRHLRREARSSSHKHEYCCQMPWNQSYNDVFIRCKALNESQTGPYTFVWKWEIPMPNFRFAAMCPEEGEAGKPPEDSEESSEEFDKCIDSPFTDCESQCVYKELGVLDSEERPKKKEMNDLMFHLLNSDELFKDVVHHATSSCMKKYKKAIKKFGGNKIDSCAAMMVLGYCMDYEIAKYCPKDCQTPLNEDRECD